MKNFSQSAVAGLRNPTLNIIRRKTGEKSARLEVKIFTGKTCVHTILYHYIKQKTQSFKSHKFPFIIRLHVIHNMCGDKTCLQDKSYLRELQCSSQSTQLKTKSKKRSLLIMAQKNNRIVVPEAKAAMEQFKMQAANEVGVNLQNGYNGDLTARQAGSIGGQMVKKMIESYENNLSAK